MYSERPMALLFASLALRIAAAAQCLSGGINFSTQAVIDDFAIANPGCTEILGEVTIQGANITNLQGLAQVERFSGGLSISNCTQLASLNGLENTTTIDFLQISNCDALTDLSGLDGLTTISSFVQIRQNALLAHLYGLEALQSIEGFVQIENNDALLDLAGLSSLASINSFVQIQNDPQLESLDGPDVLTAIGGYLQISSNPVLTDLSGLSSLQNISSFLQISNNNTLASIHGLEGLDPTSFSLLTLTSCPSLSQCAIESVCTYLDGTGQRAISGNAPGCASVAEVQTACLTIGLDEHLATPLTLFPNPAHGSVRVDGIVATTPVEIVDGLGVLVGRRTLSSASVLDVRDLAPGVYVLRSNDHGASVNVRLIIE